MPLYEPVVPVRYVRVLLDYLRSLGDAPRDDPADVISSALLSAEINAGIPIGMFDRLLCLCLERSGRSDIAFEIDRRITLETHGLVGWAGPRCRTLDEALRLSARHYRLINTCFFLIYQREEDHAKLIYRPAAPMSKPCLLTLLEIHALGLHSAIRAVMKDRTPAYDIHLPMEPPAYAARFREIWPARVHFGLGPLPEVHALIPGDALNLPIIRGEGKIDERELLAGDRSRVTTYRNHWSEWTLLMLREAEACQPSLEEFAAMLNVSPRTFSRRLSEEGHNFRDMARQVRHQRACDLLQYTNSGIAHIAYRLGYTSVTNFSHAFSTESGMSPRGYRIARQPRPSRER